MNKAPIKTIKKETASLLASLFFIALEVGILRMPANERRSREIGAYTIDLLSQDNVVSKRKIGAVKKRIVPKKKKDQEFILNSRSFFLL